MVEIRATLPEAEHFKKLNRGSRIVSTSAKFFIGKRTLDTKLLDTLRA